MNARKIAKTPAATYLVAMPVSYDPAKVTAEDLANDGALYAGKVDIEPLFLATSGQWDNAVETAGYVADDGPTDERAVEDMEDSRRQAIDAWRDALTACDAGNADAAREALGRARSLAAQAGDDAPERAALAMFEAA